jgi:hypothetical protein
VECEKNTALDCQASSLIAGLCIMTPEPGALISHPMGVHQYNEQSRLHLG